MAEHYDYLVIGSGMGGLTVGSLLAKHGAKVGMLEAHEYPGGCCHTFPMAQYRFCAAVHYIFYCGEGAPLHNYLKKIGLAENVTFEPLDPDGYDHFSCPEAGIRFPIPNGLDRWQQGLERQFPAEREAIQKFFVIVSHAINEFRRLPYECRWHDVVEAAITLPHIFRYRKSTLQDVFDQLKCSPALQAVLATQVGDLGLAPMDVSFLIYCALIWSYGSGAYYPSRHFSHMIDSIAGMIQTQPGCQVHYRAEVVSARYERGRIASVRTKDGREFTSDVFISNIDPRVTADLIGREHFPKRFLKKLNYSYSTSSFTVYLGLKGIDLREFGFGNWNVWHYPHLDINRIYQQQNSEGDLDEPWLFLSTPSLCTPQKGQGSCPEDGQILELVTTCNFGRFQRLQQQGKAAYVREKNRIAREMMKEVERHYIPGLRRHTKLMVAGSPTTNKTYLWAPAGHIYGSELTPHNVDFSRLKYRSPIPNLYFTGANAEFPSIGATVVGGCRLYSLLTGDSVNPGRDRFSLI